MKLKTKLLFGCMILLLATFVAWEFTKSMTPNNYKLDVFILSEIKNVLETKDIDAAIEQLKFESKIETADPATFDADRVLIINSNDAIDKSDFIAICHINRWFTSSKEAQVLYKNGEIKSVRNWMDLIDKKKDFEFFEVILK